jgi:hypothetical protein
MAPCRLCRVGGSKSPRRNLGVDSSRWRFHPSNLKICQCHIVLQTNVETLVRCCSSLQYTSHNACTQARQHISTTMKSKASGLKNKKRFWCRPHEEWRSTRCTKELNNNRLRSTTSVSSSSLLGCWSQKSHSRGRSRFLFRLDSVWRWTKRATRTRVTAVVLFGNRPGDNPICVHLKSFGIVLSSSYPNETRQDLTKVMMMQQM